MNEENRFAIKEGFLIHISTAAQIKVAAITPQTPPSVCFLKAARELNRLAAEAKRLGSSPASTYLLSDVERYTKASEVCARMEKPITPEPEPQFKEPTCAD